MKEFITILGLGMLLSLGAMAQDLSDLPVQGKKTDVKKRETVNKKIVFQAYDQNRKRFTITMHAKVDKDFESGGEAAVYLSHYIGAKISNGRSTRFDPNVPKTTTLATKANYSMRTPVSLAVWGGVRAAPKTTYDVTIYNKDLGSGVQEELSIVAEGYNDIGSIFSVKMEKLVISKGRILSTETKFNYTMKLIKK